MASSVEAVEHMQDNALLAQNKEKKQSFVSNTIELVVLRSAWDGFEFLDDLEVGSERRRRRAIPVHDDDTDSDAQFDSDSNGF